MVNLAEMQKDANTQMSSMIDVVFLLLIYFILVHKPIVEETLFNTGLGSGGGGKPGSTLLWIDVTQLFKDDPEKDLTYYTIRNKLWKLDDIQDLLYENFSDDDTSTLLINCGPNARHEKLIRLLDVCHTAGVTNLTIVNDEGIPFKEKKNRIKISL